jgi:shikimate kinase
MPGVGKSTIGVIFAKQTARAFIDTDVLIQLDQHRPLQEIVDTQGHLALRAIEERILLALRCENTVIATGGSAVYSDVAMRHLRSIGTLVYLRLDLATLEQRVADFSRRGLARRADQTFADLYAERTPLYASYADITIDCAGKTPEAIGWEIAAALTARTPP